MSGAHGTSNIQKIVFFGLQFGKDVAAAAKSPGALGKAAAFADAQLLMDALDLGKIDLAEVEDEFMELDQADIEDLVAACRDRFGLSTDEASLESAVIEAFQAAMYFIDGVRRMGELWPKAFAKPAS